MNSSGGERRADPDVLPVDPHARHGLVDHREHQRRQHEAYREVDRTRQLGPVCEQPDAHQRFSAARPALNASDTISRKPIPRTIPNDSSRARTMPHRPGRRAPCRRPPDAVERVLQFGEDRRRADEQQHQAEDPGQHAFGRPACTVSSSASHRRRALRAEQAVDLLEDLAARGVFAEDQSGDRDDDEQQRCDREHRVVGQRRAHALRVVLHPRDGGGPEQIRDIPVVHAEVPGCCARASCPTAAPSRAADTSFRYCGARPVTLFLRATFDLPVRPDHPTNRSRSRPPRRFSGSDSTRAHAAATASGGRAQRARGPPYFSGCGSIAA